MRMPSTVPSGPRAIKLGQVIQVLFWEPVGDHVVCIQQSKMKEEVQHLAHAQPSETYGSKMIPGAEMADYPGVVMLFPLTIVSPSPWALRFCTRTCWPELIMRSPAWRERESSIGHGLEEVDIVRLSDLETHPLESGISR